MTILRQLRVVATVLISIALLPSRAEALAIPGNLIDLLAWDTLADYGVVGQCDYPDDRDPDFPDGANLTTYYDTFDSAYGGANTEIMVDFYHAVGQYKHASDHPALVIVHGGAWKLGCRKHVYKEATRASHAGFLVFSIDYRLSCNSDNRKLADEVRKMCIAGAYLYESIDVKKAIAWADNNAASIAGAAPYNQTYSGKLAVLGLSSGGNLAYMARETGSSTDHTLPDVVAGWSGPTELGKLKDGHFAWDHSTQPTFIKSQTEIYMGGATDVCTPDCPQSWYDYSPWTRLGSSTNLTPVFVANSNLELVPVEEATDYRDRLGGRGVPKKFCQVGSDSVPSSLHGMDYIDVNCNAPGSDTVWNETISFFKRYV